MYSAAVLSPSSSPAAVSSVSAATVSVAAAAVVSSNPRNQRMTMVSLEMRWRGGGRQLYLGCSIGKGFSKSTGVVFCFSKSTLVQTLGTGVDACCTCVRL